MRRLRSENKSTGKVYYYLDGKRASFYEYSQASRFRDLHSFETVTKGDIVRQYSTIGKSIL